MRRTKNGKAVGLNDIPVWRCLQEDIGLFNTILESKRNVGVSVFKSKCHVQSYINNREIKLMSHAMKIWERTVETRLRREVKISEPHCGY